MHTFAKTVLFFFKTTKVHRHFFSKHKILQNVQILKPHFRDFYDFLLDYLCGFWAIKTNVISRDIFFFLISFFFQIFFLQTVICQKKTNDITFKQLISFFFLSIFGQIWHKTMLLIDNILHFFSVCLFVCLCLGHHKWK